MNTEELEKLIKKSLDDFYTRRLTKLNGLKLKQTLAKKNPYLFRATGIIKASEIVEGMLAAYMSSSDEGIFGDAFFEPIAKLASRGTVAPSEGVDVAVETETRYLAIAVKSGPNIFNSSQARKQNDQFNSLRSRLLKLHKQFDALLGHCYGRKRREPTDTFIYRIRSGQAFWEELTGDPEFYLKLIRLMRDYPLKHRKEYEKSWAKAVNRFTREFLQDFCNEDGSINWDKLVEFNSGTRKPVEAKGSRKSRIGPPRNP